MLSGLPRLSAPLRPPRLEHAERHEPAFPQCAPHDVRAQATHILVLKVALAHEHMARFQLAHRHMHALGGILRRIAVDEPINRHVEALRAKYFVERDHLAHAVGLHQRNAQPVKITPGHLRHALHDEPVGDALHQDDAPRGKRLQAIVRPQAHAHTRVIIQRTAAQLLGDARAHRHDAIRVERAHDIRGMSGDHALRPSTLQHARQTALAAGMQMKLRFVNRKNPRALGGEHELRDGAHHLGTLGAPVTAHVDTQHHALHRVARIARQPRVDELDVILGHWLGKNLRQLLGELGAHGTQLLGSLQPHVHAAVCLADGLGFLTRQCDCRHRAVKVQVARHAQAVQTAQAHDDFFVCRGL